MSKLSNLALVSLGAAAMLAFSGAGFADQGPVTANPANGKKIFENGKGDNVPACATCHGDKAMGNDDMGTPRLANIGFVYIVKQLHNFKDDQRKDMTMFQMNDIAKGLTDQDMRDLASYEDTFPLDNPEVSDLKQLKANGTVVGESYKGKILVTYGSDKVSACKSCHSYDGRGADPIFPKIGHQKYVYLVNQLTHWRDGTRANDPEKMMEKIAQKLSDDDIHNAATFLSQASDSTAGDGYQFNNETVLENIKIVK
jgi:cytochrome c553